MFPWTAFLPYVIVVAITPGPNNIMSMNNAAQKGFRRALPFNFGILAGFFFVMILCTVFSTLLFTLIPKVQFFMKVLGGAYMLYLALKTVLPSKKRNKLKDSSGNFAAGAALQLVNPKIMIYGVTAMSSFILPWYAERKAGPAGFTGMPILIFFAFFLAFAGFASTLCWSASGSLFSKIFSEHGRVLNIIMALLLVYCAVSLFL